MASRCGHLIESLSVIAFMRCLDDWGLMVLLHPRAASRFVPKCFVISRPGGLCAVFILDCFDECLDELRRVLPPRAAAERFVLKRVRRSGGQVQSSSFIALMSVSMSGSRSASESRGAICPKACAASRRTSEFSSFIALMSGSMSGVRSASESHGAICPRASCGGLVQRVRRHPSLHPSLL